MKQIWKTAFLLSAGLDTSSVSAASANLNVTTLSPAAVPDAVWGLTTCSAAMGATSITCTKFTAPNSIVNDSSVIVIDDAGPGRAPLVKTISNAGTSGGQLTITLQAPAVVTNAIPIEHAGPLLLNAPGSFYSFASTQTISCTAPCAAITPSTATPAVLTPVSAGIANGGSGGTTSSGSNTGACTVIATDQNFLGDAPATVPVTITGGTITHVSSGGLSGDVTSITGGYSLGGYTEPVSGCGSLSGAVLTMAYGVALEQTNPGTGLYANGGAPARWRDRPFCNGTISFSKGSL